MLDQENNLLAIMELVKFYQECGGDIWDKMGHAPVHGISPPPPIPGVTPVAYPGAPKSVNASAEESRNSPNVDYAERSQATLASNGIAAERPAPQPPTAPQQKKGDKANGADIVRRLQHICTDADPTRLYRILVKIGQG